MVEVGKCPDCDRDLVDSDCSSCQMAMMRIIGLFVPWGRTSSSVRIALKAYNLMREASSKKTAADADSFVAGYNVANSLTGAACHVTPKLEGKDIPLDRAHLMSYPLVRLHSDKWRFYLKNGRSLMGNLQGEAWLQEDDVTEGSVGVKVGDRLTQADLMSLLFILGGPVTQEVSRAD